MKIKVKPEDFVVKENVSLKLSRSGRYKIYLLRKRYWNTMDALKLIARKSGVPLSRIGYGGRKDRYALTYQYLSVPREYNLECPDPRGFSESDLTEADRNLSLSFLGFSDDFVSSKTLSGNDFEITVRDMDKDEFSAMLVRIDEVKRFGYPNYFDDQRFGSVPAKEYAGDGSGGTIRDAKADNFLAERLIKGQYKGALKIYLTGVYPGYKKEEKERRRKIARMWGKWDLIKDLCRTPVEKDIVQILKKGSTRKNLLMAINRIPKEELSMFFSAYQSFLWNMTLEKLLQILALSSLEKEELNFSTVRGRVTDYRFYGTLSRDLYTRLKGMVVPTIAQKIPACEQLVETAIELTMEERGISLSMFNLRDVRKSFFKSYYRNAIVVPERFSVQPASIQDALDDDMYPGSLKATISFFLPPGSFATMCIKALTCNARRGTISPDGSAEDEDYGDSWEDEDPAIQGCDWRVRERF